MKSHLIIQNICLLTSIACLGVPYILAGFWPIVLFFLAIVVFGVVIKKVSVFWSASILLFVFVLLAVAAILANLSTPLMIIACTAALAWWDLTNFEQGKVIGQPIETKLLFERAHLQSLALAISAGLVLAFTSYYLDLQIPFLGMVCLVLLAIGSLTYGFQTLAKIDD